MFGLKSWNGFLFFEIENSVHSGKLDKATFRNLFGGIGVLLLQVQLLQSETSIQGLPREWAEHHFMLLATMFFFSSENKNLFKNLKSVLLSKHLSKNLLRLTWENKGPSRGFLLYYSLSTVSLLSSFASPFLLFKISTSVQPTFVDVIQMRLVQITWDLLRATAFLDFLELVKLAVVMTFLGCDF